MENLKHLMVFIDGLLIFICVIICIFYLLMQIKKEYNLKKEKGIKE